MSHDATLEPALRSWVASANTDSTDFPIQNLPIRCPHLADSAKLRIGLGVCAATVIA